MYQVSKDKKTEFFRFLEDENGEWIRDENGCHKTESTGIRDNPCYVNAKRPKFCRKRYTDEDIENDDDRLDMTPCNECWMEDCKFLATCPVDEKEYTTMVKAWEKASKSGEFDHLESGQENNEDSDDESSSQ